MMKTIRLALLFLLAGTAFAAQRSDLNQGWKFCVDPAKAGEKQSWFQRMPAGVEEVDLPHTWNLGAHEGFLGTAWYFKAFPRGTWTADSHVELHFGATFYKARVWLNGNLLGEHEGGFSEYYFDIGQLLRDENFLAVEINNEPQIDTIPGIPLKSGPHATIYDWWPYGGIVRGAWLTASRPVLVRRQQIDSRVAGGEAQVTTRIFVENFSSKNQSLKVRVKAFSVEDNAPVASAEVQLSAHPGAQSVEVPFTITSVKLWGIDNPYLYRSDVSIVDSQGRVLDDSSDRFGVRTVEIRDRHLFLNGERVRLSGLTRHEDSPWEGMAETRGTMIHDLDDMKALQTTLTRPVHYPQHPFVYDYADRNGILMIPEIPMWQFDESEMTNPKVVALAKRMLKEMVEKNYNHPSIFAWSMDNESATDTPGGIEYFKTMYSLAKQLDPHRFVSAADDRIAFVDNPATNASSLADFVMWNEYFGSWDASESLLPAAFEKIEKGYPDKMVIVTEFGFPGLFAESERTADRMRVDIIKRQIAAFSKRDWIAGAILWSYQDYHSFHNLRSGQTDSYVDHGVVDKDRQRKPSYYVWRQENSPAHVSVEWTYDAKGVPTGFKAAIARRAEHELPSYPLVGYRLEWRVLDQQDKTVAHSSPALAAMGTAQVVTGSWEPKEAKRFRLELRLLRPRGAVALLQDLTWRDPDTGGFQERDLPDGSAPPEKQ
ncbi:MAG TPA: glycoside hydrolase family 2 TIM barrel-domain containing protein [Candidatus Angelobacter sp.]|nr:glycoside hydrolase family 2 TIM barrel-domain containing protein [Candidatus Angelobacter sp.]